MKISEIFPIYSAKVKVSNPDFSPLQINLAGGEVGQSIAIDWTQK